MSNRRNLRTRDKKVSYTEDESMDLDEENSNTEDSSSFNINKDFFSSCDALLSLGQAAALVDESRRNGKHFSDESDEDINEEYDYSSEKSKRGRRGKKKEKIGLKKKTTLKIEIKKEEEHEAAQELMDLISSPTKQLQKSPGIPIKKRFSKQQTEEVPKKTPRKRGRPKKKKPETEVKVEISKTVTKTPKNFELENNHGTPSKRMTERQQMLLLKKMYNSKKSDEESPTDDESDYDDKKDESYQPSSDEDEKSEPSEQDDSEEEEKIEVRPPRTKKVFKFLKN